MGTGHNGNGRPMRVNNKGQGNRKLGYADVQNIRTLYANGATQSSLCREYGMSVGQIGRIVRGESWADAGMAVVDAPPVSKEEIDKSLEELSRRLNEAESVEVKETEEQARARKLADEFLHGPRKEPAPMAFDEGYDPPAGLAEEPK